MEDLGSPPCQHVLPAPAAPLRPPATEGGARQTAGSGQGPPLQPPGKLSFYIEKTMIKEGEFC